MSQFSESFDVDFAATFTEFFDEGILYITDHANPKSVLDQYDIKILASSLAETVTDDSGRKKVSVAGRHFRFVLPDNRSSFEIKLEHDYIMYGSEKWILIELVEGQSVGSKIVKYRAERSKIVNIGKDHTLR